ncbi:MAG: hypothetical protein ABSF36_03340 [Candidatus Methanomethylicaceae archaeon]
MNDRNVQRVMEIRDLAKKTTALADELIAAMGGKEPAEWARDSIELICRVYNKGSTLSWEDVKAIWADMGKQPQGVAAFLRGDAKIFARMVDGKLSLTMYASELVQEETGLPLEEYAKKIKS